MFRSNENVGKADAESDDEYLKECFVRTDDLDVLLDVKDSQSIALGRTGVGKSALLKYIGKNTERCIVMEPLEMSLKYALNSDLKIYEDRGVQMDLFYQLLWRHVLVVDLLRSFFGDQKRREWREVLARVFQRGKESDKKILENYVEKHGDDFWKDAESIVKVATKKLEKDLSAALHVPGLTVSGNMSSANESREQYIDEKYIRKAQKIVDSVKIEELSKVMKIINSNIFSDNLKPHYIVIDQLDERWIDDEMKYKLIRALIETMKSFNGKIHNVKIIIALRSDLLDRVIESTRDSGFQREKYESLYLRLKWTRSQLEELLRVRVVYLIKHKYVNRDVTLPEIFPDKIRQQTSIQFLLDRTLNRPRDVIMFMNSCLNASAGEQVISAQSIKTAEENYSRRRLDYLFDEWGTFYPAFKLYTSFLNNSFFLKGLSATFSHGDLDVDKFSDFILTIAGHEEGSDPLCKEALLFVGAEKDVQQFWSYLCAVLYKVGIVGLKTSSTTRMFWSYLDDKTIPESDITYRTKIGIHPMLWKALRVPERNIKPVMVRS